MSSRINRLRSREARTQWVVPPVVCQKLGACAFAKGNPDTLRVASLDDYKKSAMPKSEDMCVGALKATIAHNALKPTGSGPFNHASAQLELALALPDSASKAKSTNLADALIEESKGIYTNANQHLLEAASLYLQDVLDDVAPR